MRMGAKVHYLVKLNNHSPIVKIAKIAGEAQGGMSLLQDCEADGCG